MDKKEEFKIFARKYPSFASHVASKKTTWQELYELYDVYKVYYPGIGKNNEDYLIVQTIPGTWNIVDFYATLEPDLVFPRKIIDKKKAVLRLHHN